MIDYYSRDYPSNMMRHEPLEDEEQDQADPSPAAVTDSPDEDSPDQAASAHPAGPESSDDESASDQPSAETFDRLVSFLREYLVCDDHQLTVLALWIAHTWCFEVFPTTAYLNVRSPESQSGKTVCMELLELLALDPWLAAGPDATTVIDRLLNYEHLVHTGKEVELPPPYTILLDDCHHTFGLSERPPLIAVLNSGSRETGRYVRAHSVYCVFGPKAFAGAARLPHSLAARCIPIVLFRKPPSAAVSRLTSESQDIKKAAGELQRWLYDWTAANSEALGRAAKSAPAALPSGLTPREQDCAEPLLHVADRLGGDWPERARAALASVLNLTESSLSVQALGDIRAWFFLNDYPEYVASRALLAVLRTLEHRPWSAWPANAGRRLGALLHPFGIMSRNLHVGSQTVFRGYLRKDFALAWERYLPPLPSVVQPNSNLQPNPQPAFP